MNTKNQNKGRQAAHCDGPQQLPKREVKQIAVPGVALMIPKNWKELNGLPAGCDIELGFWKR